MSTRPLFYVLKHILGQKIRKNAKNEKKMQKNCKKICIYQKNVVPLHRI